jgi:Tfp pilus assembly protein PilF
MARFWVDGIDKLVFPPRRSALEGVTIMRWAILPLIFFCATVVLTVEEGAAQSDSSSGGWSFGQSITQHFQSPSKPPAAPSTQDDDPISLKTKPKVGAELYVAVARLYVESGKLPEAEEQYQQALKLAPNDLRALLGYAMLKDQMNQPQEAIKLYQQAEKKYPKHAAVYNNLAIHYARHEMVGQAIEAGRRAVELRPREPRYRNNLAALLVEAGMPQDAFKQLREVYDEPVAHYNLGFLLNKRGMTAGALQEFTIALQMSPKMDLARQWIERLSRGRAESGPAVAGMMPAIEQAPAGTAPQRAMQLPESAPAPLAPSPPEYSAQPRPAQAQNSVQPPWQPPLQSQAQNSMPSSEPARWQSPPAPTGPARWQYPAQAQYPAVAPQNWPRNAAPPNAAGPQYPVPQNQNSAMASQPAGTASVVVAARDPQANGVRVIPPPAADNIAPRRLPPVSDSRNPADVNFPGQSSELVAPNPPDWRK